MTVNQYTAHQNLLRAFEKAVTREFPRVILLPYTVGLYRDYATAERVIYIGRKGVPDILALLPCGSFLWLDAKTGSGRFTKEQKFFDERIAQTTGRRRVFALLSVEQGLAILREFHHDDRAKTF